MFSWLLGNRSWRFNICIFFSKYLVACQFSSLIWPLTLLLHLSSQFYTYFVCLKNKALQMKFLAALAIFYGTKLSSLTSLFLWQFSGAVSSYSQNRRYPKNSWCEVETLRFGGWSLQFWFRHDEKESCKRKKKVKEVYER